jgi:uncharacterized protein YkwD
MSSRFASSIRLAAVALSTTFCLAAPTLAQANAAIDVTELAVVDLINAQRLANGLGLVGLDDRLSTLADMHSTDMATTSGCFQHDSCDGTPWATRMRSLYPSGGMGEIIAFGYPTAAAVVDGWMNSPGHKAQILTADYKALGVGLVSGASGKYWTVDFGSLAPVSAGTVPEPATYVLMALGLVGVAAASARRRMG